MQTDPQGPVALGVRPEGAPASCPVTWLPIAQLRTSFAALRQGRVGLLAPRTLAAQPLRVVRFGDTYEVVDGFKALERWHDEGAAHVPAIVEDPCEVTHAKRLLLAANAPRRTLSILDEARVVTALREDDGLGPKTIARLLGRKPDWVRRRLTLARGLAPSVARKVDAGAIGPSLAEALVALRSDDQEALVAALERHRLRVREALALLSALRATGDAGARRELLADPRRLFQQPSTLQSSAAARLEERLRRAQRALADLACVAGELDDAALSEAERRRLGALRRALQPQIDALAERPTGSAAPGPSPPPRLEPDHDRPDLSDPEHAARGPTPRRRSDPPALPRARPVDELPRGAAARGPAPGRERSVPAARARPQPADERADGRGARPRAGAAGARPEHARDRAPTRAQPQDDPAALGADADAEHARVGQAGGEEARPLPRGRRGARAEGADDDEDPARAA